MWCDLYDNFEIAATNPKLCYTHTHCLARRDDSYCRYDVDYRDRQPDENYYEWLKRMRDKKRAEANEEAWWRYSNFRPPRHYQFNSSRQHIRAN